MQSLPPEALTRLPIAILGSYLPKGPQNCPTFQVGAAAILMSYILMAGCHIMDENRLEYVGKGCRCYRGVGRRSVKDRGTIKSSEALKIEVQSQAAKR
jgi:hypothetical protein